MELQPHKRIIWYDVLAAVVCVALFGYFFVSIRFGIRAPDESFYLAVAQRFAKGDRPLVDEWQLSQLSELFLVPFYQLFKWLTGSTEGLVLFMRQTFLLINFACYWWFYRKLRSYQLAAVIAVAVFCGYIPSAIFALNYYTMSLRLLLAFCLVLLFHPGEAPSRCRLALAGVLLSAAVLNEPPLAMLYVVYSLCVLVFELTKKRKQTFGQSYAFVINRRTWFWVSVPVVLCAGMVFVFLCFKCGFKNLLAAIPELLTDSEYNFSATGNVRSFLLSKLSYAGVVFGSVNLILSSLLCAAAVWFLRIKKNQNSRPIFFLLSLLQLLSCCIWSVVTQILQAPAGSRMMFHLFYYVATPLPLYSFGLVNYLLCRKKDGRLFLLWLIGLLSSFCMDSFSDITLGNGAILCVFPGVFCFAELIQEFGAGKTTSHTFVKEKQKTGSSGGSIAPSSRRRHAVSTICMFSFCLFLVWEGINAYSEGAALFAEQYLLVKHQQPLTMERVEYGPYKGIYTISAIRSSYDELLEDLDVIKTKTDGPVYIDPSDAAAFLYLDLPSANCCSWNSKSPRDRQVRFFASHPEKLPEAMYWIKDDSLSLWSYRPEQAALQQELSRQICDGEEIEGKRGRIVVVREWNDLENPALARWFKTHDTRF